MKHHQKQHLQKRLSEKALAQGAFCNFSQDVARTTVTRGHIGTFTTGCQIYSYEKDCMLTGSAHLRLIGWPVTAMPLSLFNDSTLRNFAGDSFSLPIATIVATAVSLNPYCDWWE